MYLRQLMDNSVLWTAILSWAIAQILKFILVFLLHRKLDFRRFTGSGGMPSSHSSLVVSLAMAVGFVNGFDSLLFAACSVMALIVMYDAAGVRRSAGQQAAILNRIVEDWGKEDYAHTEKKLKELLGHTPLEVFAGAILGMIIAIIRYM
jgi:acid phosphatase family membrane protein YuiD